MEEREVALQQKAFKLPGRNQVRCTSFRITFLNIISLIIIVVDQCGTQHMRTLEATWLPKAIWLLICVKRPSEPVQPTA